MTDDQQQKPCTPPPCPATAETQLRVEHPPPRVILGARVHYRGKQGRQTVRVADVTCTVDHLDPDGVTAGDIPPLSSPVNVHLFVMTPSERGFFTEYDVPFDERLTPGTWCWPEGVTPPGWLRTYRAWQYQQLERQHGISGQALRGLYELEFPDGVPSGARFDVADLAEKIGQPEDVTRDVVDRLIALGLIERIPDDDPGTHLHNDATDGAQMPPADDMVSIMGALSANHLRVLVAIADGNPAAGASLAEVAADTGLSADQLDRIVSDLDEQGLIDRRSWAPLPTVLPVIAGAAPADECCGGGAPASPPTMRCRCIDPSKHGHAQPSGEIDDVPPPPASGDDEVVGSVPVGGGPEPAPADGGLSSP